MTQDVKRQMDEIETLLESHSEGLSRSQVLDGVGFFMNPKTLQRRLASLVDKGRILKEGDEKGTKYYSAKRLIDANKGQLGSKVQEVFSQKSKDILCIESFKVCCV